ISEPEVAVPTRPANMIERGLRKLRHWRILSGSQCKTVCLIPHTVCRCRPGPHILHCVPHFGSVSLWIETGFADGVQWLAGRTVGIEIVCSGLAAVFQYDCRYDGSLQPIPKVAVAQHGPCANRVAACSRFLNLGVKVVRRG